MTPILTILELEKRLHHRPILRGVSLRLTSPQIVRVSGSNGSGKSTLLRCTAGIWRPDAGDVLVGGRSVHRDRRARAQIGYAPDVFAPFPDLTVAEMLGLVASLKCSRPPSVEGLERLGVVPYLSQRMCTLSTGQQRRAAVLAAMIGDPALLILDEPTNGLDPDGVLLLRDLLLEQVSRGVAVLLVTHDSAFASSVRAETIELCDGRLGAAPEARRSLEIA